MVLTLDKNLDIIEELKREKLKRCVSELYRVPLSMVGDI